MRTVYLMAFVVWTASAQQELHPAYMDTSLPFEQRAADLVHRMTVEEKATQLVNQARAIPRLNVPAYDWWSESLHGVAVNGTTEFPEPVGLAATFDTRRSTRWRSLSASRAASSTSRPSARATAGSSRVSTSGRRTSTSSAIRAGAAARRRTGKTRS